MLIKINKLIVLGVTAFSCLAQAQDTIRIFPLENYSQNIPDFIDSNNEKPLISSEILEDRVANYKEHLYGNLSPWSQSFINAILTAPSPNDIQDIEQSLWSLYQQKCDSADAVSFAENYKAYSCKWFSDIYKKMNLSQFKSLQYDKHNSAIATENILARALPTDSPLFKHHTFAGEGYPFDCLQVSALWLGSPLYILGDTDDKAWALVITNSGFIAWVPSQKIARVDSNFIREYGKHVHENGLKIITHTETIIKNMTEKAALHTSYIGSIFPASSPHSTNHIMIPSRHANGFAALETAAVNKEYVATFPVQASPKNFAHIIEELIDRPYGWGGMYFYNDCSQEIQSIFTTFGIWLPRNSVDQVQAGKIEDLSELTTPARIGGLSTSGRHLVTLVYIKGHIMLYVGNHVYNSVSGIDAPVVYNNMWGMRPADNTYRSIIGQAAFFPIFDSNKHP
ncbi:MAG: SH3 domain-containing protein, partial [Bdellovibrionota bacterium]